VIAKSQHPRQACAPGSGRPRNVALSLLAFALALSVAPAHAAAVERPGLWLTTLEPIWRDIRTWPTSDYRELGKNAAAWSHVLRRLSVFQFSEKYAVHGDAEELGALIALLKDNRVEVAVQGIPLIATRQCGLGVESFGTKDETLVAVKRLQSLGAAVRYIVLDEPLYYGHFFKGGRTTVACRLSLSAVLDQVIDRERSLRAAAPGVRIGDVEPFGLTDVSARDWVAAYQQWLTLYREKAGHAWDFAQADIVWTRANWREQFFPALKAIQSAGVIWAPMYTADARATSNADWASQISKAYHQFEGDLGVHPPQAVIASWTDYPRANLPETEAASLTGAALNYLRYRDGASK
jgi:hypothetical protein